MKKFLSYRQLSATANKNCYGFTLLEVLATLSIFLVVIMMVGSVFILAQRVYNRGNIINELTQNVRVCFDRLSRELRQASYLVTDASATSTEIFFQDGHDSDYISYIRYYLNDDRLYREHKAYYFPPLPADPAQFVRYNSVDQFGADAASTTLSSQVVGEYFNDISFLENNGLITIIADLEKANVNSIFDTKIYIRNW